MRVLFFVFCFLIVSCEKDDVTPIAPIDEDISVRTCPSNNSDLTLHSYSLDYNPSTCTADFQIVYNGYTAADKPYITDVDLNIIALNHQSSDCGPGAAFCVLGKSWSTSYSGDQPADSYSFSVSDTRITINWEVDLTSLDDWIDKAFGGMNEGSCAECGLDKDYTTYLSAKATISHVNGACSWTTDPGAHDARWEGGGYSSDWDDEAGTTVSSSSTISLDFAAADEVDHAACADCTFDIGWQWNSAMSQMGISFSDIDYVDFTLKVNETTDSGSYTWDFELSDSAPTNSSGTLKFDASVSDCYTAQAAHGWEWWTTDNCYGYWEDIESGIKYSVKDIVVVTNDGCEYYPNGTIWNDNTSY